MSFTFRMGVEGTGFMVVEGTGLAVVVGLCRVPMTTSLGFALVDGFPAVVELCLVPMTTGFGPVLIVGLALVEGLCRVPMTTGLGLVLIVGLALVEGRGRASMPLAAFLACPRLIPWLTIRSLSTQKSRPWLFALFRVALYCPEFLKPDAGSAKKSFEVETRRSTDERLAAVVGLLLDLAAEVLLTWDFCVVALGAWTLGALAARTLGALPLGPAEAGFAGFGLPFLAMAGMAATAKDSATAAAVRKRSEYFMWSPPRPSTSG